MYSKDTMEKILCLESILELYFSQGLSIGKYSLCPLVLTKCLALAVPNNPNQIRAIPQFVTTFIVLVTKLYLPSKTFSEPQMSRPDQQFCLKTETLKLWI